MECLASSRREIHGPRAKLARAMRRNKHRGIAGGFPAEADELEGFSFPFSPRGRAKRLGRIIYAKYLTLCSSTA